MSPKDDFMVYVPNGLSLPRLCIGYAAVERALDELGRTSARVRRVTEDEIARDVTSDFVPEDYVAPAPGDYPDDEVATRRRQRASAANFSFAKMVHR